MLILGLVALVSDEVLELMFEEFSDKYKVCSTYWNLPLSTDKYFRKYFRCLSFTLY